MSTIKPSLANAIVRDTNERNAILQRQISTSPIRTGIRSGIALTVHTLGLAEDKVRNLREQEQMSDTVELMEAKFDFLDRMSELEARAQTKGIDITGL